MIFIHINTFLIILLALVFIALVNIFLFRFETSNHQGHSNLFYTLKKFFYILRQSELNRNFFKNIFFQSFFFIVSALPLLYYSNNNYGYNLDYLLSSIEEKDFLMLWVILNTLFFYVGDFRTYKNIVAELIAVTTSIVYLLFIFLLFLKLSNLGFSFGNTIYNILTALSMITLIVFTRMLFHKRLVNNHISLSIQQFKRINYDIFRLSLCFIMSSLLIRMFNLFVDESLEKLILYSITGITFLSLKFEGLIWKYVTNKQNNFLYNKYQKYFQYGLIVTLCLLYCLY